MAFNSLLNKQWELLLPQGPPGERKILGSWVRSGKMDQERKGVFQVSEIQGIINRKYKECLEVGRQLFFCILIVLQL